MSNQKSGPKTQQKEHEWGWGGVGGGWGGGGWRGGVCVWGDAQGRPQMTGQNLTFKVSHACTRE